MNIMISPSILASDYANLQSELERISASDLIHIDVMDGHFVPNISIGAPVVAAAKKVCDIPFDVHLMISDPLSYVEQFGLSHLVLELARLCPDAQKQKELIDAFHANFRGKNLQENGRSNAVVSKETKT